MPEGRRDSRTKMLAKGKVYLCISRPYDPPVSAGQI